MRQIKFRAWSEKLKRFCTDSEWTISHENGLVSGFFNADIESHELFLQQFTGLRDQNGKDIYEGDIIITETSMTGGEVTFDNGTFMWLDDPLGYFLEDTPKPSIFLPGEWAIVVGNIHENSDLLQSQ